MTFDFEWINATLELPEDGQLCAVYDPNHPSDKVWSAIWNKKEQVFYANGGWFELNEITHWMKLPKPPGM